MNINTQNKYIARRITMRYKVQNIIPYLFVSAQYGVLW